MGDFHSLIPLPRISNVYRYRRSQIFRAQELNTDHTLYVTLCTSTVGTATLDTLRSLERERRDKLILLEMVLQSHSLHQLLNVNRISDQLDCDQGVWSN